MNGINMVCESCVGLSRRAVGMCRLESSLLIIREVHVDTQVEVVVWAACLSSGRRLLSTQLQSWSVVTTSLFESQLLALM